MSEVHRLIVVGEPVPAARARKGRNGWYTPKATLEYRDRVQAAWMVAGRPTVDGPVALKATFHVPRPKQHYRANGNLKDWAEELHYCVAKPDLDNLLKNLADGLNGLAFEDDNQLVHCSVFKEYVGLGEEPHTTVALWRLM